MRTICLLLSLCLGTWALVAAEHPTLLLTPKGVEQMKAAKGTVPEFDRSVQELLCEADAALAKPICVPQPREGGGGYSHEMHKLNYYDLYSCGVAWQLTGEKRYAAKVKEIFYAYAELYPTLGYHPLGLSSVPGRIFWQTLNESVWLVHSAVAYDCIYDYLSCKERKYLETKLLRPVAEFIMQGTEDNRSNLEVFNRMHNHGTWATAGVGMIAMAMGDKDLLEKALYGTDKAGRNGGFIQQLDALFSPDGYFTEGAYYQRYAIWPFVIFAQCIDNYFPEFGIFKYRDGIILKAVDTLVQMAYEGRFMRFNDALEKGYDAQELLYAVDIAYGANPNNKQLLSIARDYQQKVLVSNAGYAVAKGIADGEAEPVMYKSCLLADGANGEKGGVGIIRSNRPGLNSALTLKATSHGLSHGHYDKLTFAYYDEGNEVITDYGASRFLNIEAKYNGHYTKQNKSYAMQTIAHNTLVVDQTSHFGADIKSSSKHWPTIYDYSLGEQPLQYISAFEQNASSGVKFHRTLVYADVDFLEYPLIMDVMKIASDDKHCYDYPIHYNGQMISLNTAYTKALNSMSVLGTANGYQHIWKEAEARGAGGQSTYTWLTGYRMYSLSMATSTDSEIYICRTGANDPDFELRSEPMLLLRESSRSDHIFATCLETHGKYDLRVEQSANLTASCNLVKVLYDKAGYVIVQYGFKDGGLVLALCLDNADKSAKHNVGGYEWTGTVGLINIK